MDNNPIKKPIPLIDRINLENAYSGYTAPDDISYSGNVDYRSIPMPTVNVPKPLSPNPEKPTSLKDVEASLLSPVKNDGKLTGGSTLRRLSEATSNRYEQYVPGGYDNEDAYGINQSFTNKMFNGVTKGLALTGTTFLQTTIGAVNGLIQAANDGKFSSFYDNEFNRSLDEFNKNLENKFATFDTKKFRDAKWYSTDYLLTGNFLWEGIVKNLGFAAGAALSGQAFAGVLRGLSMLPGLSRMVSAGNISQAVAKSEAAITGVNNTGKIKQLADSFGTAYSSLNKGQRALVAGLSTSGEAGIEAMHNLNEWRDNAINEFVDLNGRAPNKEEIQKINQQADDIGNSTYRLNMLLLGVTNYIQFPKILGSSYKSEKGLINDIVSKTKPIGKEAGKYTQKAPTKLSRVVNAVKNPYIFSYSEAFEEGSQFAISKGTEDYYDKKYSGEDASWADSMLEGYKETLTTDEGQKNILIGGISGALMLGPGRYKQSKREQENTDEALRSGKWKDTGLNSAKLSDFTNDTYDSVVRGTEIQKDREAFLIEGDILGSKNAEADYIINYLAPRAKHGRMDLVFADIKDYRTLASSEEGFAQLVREGVAQKSDTRESFKKRLDAFENTANNIKSLYSSLNLRYKGRIDEAGKEVFPQEVIDKMVYASSKITDLDQRYEELSSEVMLEGFNLDEISEALIDKDEAPLNAALQSIKDSKKLDETKKEETAEKLKDAATIAVTRNKFLQEYNDIKTKPYSYVTKTAEDIKPSDTEEIVVKTGLNPEKVVTLDEEYYLVENYKATAARGTEGVRRANKVRILKQNEDGSVEMQFSNGQIKPVTSEQLSEYNLGKVSEVEKNRSAKFVLEHLDQEFTHYGITQDGKRRKSGNKEAAAVGVVEYDHATDAVYFVYKNSIDGKVLRIETPNTMYGPKDGYKYGMIRKTGKSVSTPKKETTTKDFISQKESVTEQLSRRTKFARNLYRGVLKQIKTIEKQVEKNNKKLKTVSESLEKASLTKKGEPRKYKTADMRKLMAELLELETNVPIQNKQLLEQKALLEAELDTLEEFGKNIVPILSEDNERVLASLKRSVREVKEIISLTEENIKETERQLPLIKDLLKLALTYVNEFVEKLSKLNPGIPLSLDSYKENMERFLGDEGSQGVIDRKEGFTNQVLELENTILSYSEEVMLPDMQKSYEKMSEELNELKESLSSYQANLRAKEKILEAFETFYKQKIEKKKAEKTVTTSNTLRDSMDATLDKTGPSISYDEAFEPTPRKSDKLVVTSSIGIVDGKEYQERANIFGNNLHNLQDEGKDIKAVYVTSKTEGEIGMTGLVDSATTDSNGNELTEQEKSEAILVVMVTETENGLVPVDVNGDPITENPIEQAIYQFMPLPKLSNSYGSMFRTDQKIGSKEELTEQQKLLKEEYAAWRAQTLSLEKVSEPHVPKASFGVLEFQEGQRTSVVDAKFVESRDSLINNILINTATTTRVVEKGTTSFPNPGKRVLIETENGYAQLQNKLIEEEQANNIFKLIHILADEMINNENGLQSSKSEAALDALKGMVYWGKPTDQKGTIKKRAYSGVYFDNISKSIYPGLFIGNKSEPFSFTPTKLINNRESIVKALMEIYTNTNFDLIRRSASYVEVTNVSEKTDENGDVSFEISEVVTWPNYQSYLLSDTLPTEDGRGLSNNNFRENIPLTTVANPITESNPTNRTAVYFYNQENQTKYTINETVEEKTFSENQEEITDEDLIAFLSSVEPNIPFDKIRGNSKVIKDLFLRKMFVTIFLKSEKISKIKNKQKQIDEARAAADAVLSLRRQSKTDLEIIKENLDTFKEVYPDLKFTSKKTNTSLLNKVSKELYTGYENVKELILSGKKTTISTDNKYIPELEPGMSGVQIIDDVPFKVTYLGELSMGDVKAKTGIGWGKGEANALIKNPQSDTNFLLGKSTKHIYKLSKLDSFDTSPKAKLSDEQQSVLEDLQSKYPQITAMFTSDGNSFEAGADGQIIMNQESDTKVEEPRAIISEEKQNEFEQKLNKKLNEIMRGLNVSVRDNADFLLDRSNFPDAMTGFDSLQKIAAFRKDSTSEDKLLQTANIIYTFLGSKSKINKDIWANIDEWSGYKEAYKKHNKGKERVDWKTKNNFAHRLVIIDFIAEQLRKAVEENGLNTTTNSESVDLNFEYFKARGFRNDIYETNPIKKLAKSLLNFINKYVFRNKRFDDYNEESITNLVMEVVDDVYKEDFKKFFRVYSKNSQGEIVSRDGIKYERKDYDKTWEKDPFAHQVFKTLSGNPFIDFKLSGSQTIRKYGELYRPLDEDLHDIDGVITLDTFMKDPMALSFRLWVQENMNKKNFRRKIGKKIEQLNFYKNVKYGLPGFKFEKAFVGKDHKNAESLTITGWVDHPTLKDEYGKPKKVVLDFFLRMAEGSYPEIYDNYWKDWKQIFEAKLNMGRAKDLNDLLFFVPFKTDINKFTNKGFRFFTFKDKSKTVDENQFEAITNKGLENDFGVKNQIDQNGNIKGQANIEAMTVLFDESRLSDDTIYHEYAHHYIAWNRNAPIVKEAIEKWGTEEALVQAIGEQSVAQGGKAAKWFKNFIKWLKDGINKLSDKDKYELRNILTDAFLDAKKSKKLDLTNKYRKQSDLQSSEVEIQDKQFNPDIPEGNSYPIRVGGKYAGVITVDNNDRLMSSIGMAAIELEPEFRKKGLGKKSYIALNNKLNVNLKSENKNSLNEDSEGVWKSLVKSGLAEDKGNYYEFKPKQQTSEVEEQENNNKDEVVTYKDVKYIQGEKKGIVLNATTRVPVTDIELKINILSLFNNETTSNVTPNSRPEKFDGSVFRVYLRKKYGSLKKENWDEVEAFLKKNFPSVPFYRVKNIIKTTDGGKAWGMFANGALYVYENAEVGTAYHEVFEAVWSMFTSSGEKQNILDEFLGREGTFIDRPTGDTVKYNEATSEQIKEQLAEEFRDFMLRRSVPKGIKGYILKMFRELKNFIKKLIINPKSDINELFNKIDSGYYKTPANYINQLSYANEGIMDIDSINPIEDAEYRTVIEGLNDTVLNDVVQEMLYSTIQRMIDSNNGLFDAESLVVSDDTLINDVTTLLKQQASALNDIVLETQELSYNLKNKTVYIFKEDGSFQRSPITFDTPKEAKKWIKQEQKFDEIEIEHYIEEFKSIKNSMELIKINISDIRKMYQDRIKSYGIEIADNNETELLLSEEKTRNSDYVDATKVDNLRKMNKALKLLFSNVPLLDKNGENVFTSIGGKKTMSFAKVTNTLMKKLQSSKNVNEMQKRFRDLARTDEAYRELYKYFYNKEYDDALGFDGINTKQTYKLFSGLWKSFSLNSPVVKNVFILKNGEVEVGDANLSTEASQLRRDFVDSIVLRSKSGEGFFTMLTNGNYGQNPNNSVNDYLKNNSPKNISLFLKQLGIDFSQSEVNKLEGNQQKVLREVVGGLRDSIKNVRSVSSFSTSTLDLHKRLLQLALLKASVSSAMTESTYFNVLGEKTQSNIGGNTPSRLFRTLNQIDNLKELESTEFEYLIMSVDENDVISSNDVFVQGSHILSQMFDLKTGDKKQQTQEHRLLETGIAGGIVNEKKRKNSTSSRLPARARLLQELNLNLKGWYLNLVPGDSSTEWMTFLGNPITRSSLNYNYNSVHAIFKDYFISEVKLTREKNRNVESKHDSTDLRFFKNILSNKVINKIKKGDLSAEKIYESKTYNEDIKSSIENYIKESTKNLKLRLNEYKAIVPSVKGGKNKLDVEFVDLQGLTKEQLNKALEAVTINYIINNIEQHKLLYGDPFQYKDELKRTKSFQSPAQEIINGSPEANNVISNIWNKKYKPTQLGYTNFTRDYFKTYTLNDIQIVSKFKKYSVAEETDGGGIITFKAKRNFMIRAGQWSNKAEQQFDYEVAWEKMHKKGLKDIEKGLITEEELNEKLLELKNPKSKEAFTTMKPIARGNKHGSKKNEIVLDKYSLWPMSYRTMVKMKAKNGILLYNKMQEEDVDYVVFKSGRKVGGYNTSNAYNEKGRFNTSIFAENAPVNVSFSTIGLQVEVPSKEKSQTLKGSQVTKMITMDRMNAGLPIDYVPSKKLRDKGIVNDPNNFDLKVFEEWSNLSEKEKLEKSELYSLVKYNQELLEAQIDFGYETLLEKLGIEEKDGTATIKDFDKTVELLKNEVLKQGSNDNIIEALNVFSDNNSVLEATPAYRHISNVLYSIVDKNIVHTKINGGMKVQIMSTFFEENRTSIQEINGKKGYVSDALKFYKDEATGDNVMEIMVGRWFSDGRSDEELLEYLNTTKEGQDILKGFAFRIPTQNMNSIDAFRIAKFLPEEFGDNVVVPSSIVSKVGSDFDIDKLSMYLKNVMRDVKGNLVAVRDWLTDPVTGERLTTYEGLREAKMVAEELLTNEFEYKTDKFLKSYRDQQQLGDLFLGLTKDKQMSYGRIVKLVEKFKDKFSDELITNIISVDETTGENKNTLRIDLSALEQIFVSTTNRLGKRLDELSDDQMFKGLVEALGKKLYKEGLQNAYMNNNIDLLSHKTNHEKLTTPNSAKLMEDVAAEIDVLLKRPKIDYSSPSNFIDRLFMTDLRHAFVAGKRGVGIAATGSTNHSNNQKQLTVVDFERMKLAEPQDKEFLGDGKIRFLRKKYNNVKIKNKIYPTLSFLKNTSKQKEYISDLMGMFVDGFVDIARGPWIMRLGATPNTSGTWMFLVKLGIPIQDVAYFMNQPIIRDYLQQIENKGYSWIFIKNFVESIKESDKYRLTEAEPEDQPAKFIPTTSVLRNTIKEKTLNQKERAFQHFYLDEFLKYSMMAQHLYRITDGTNYDTAQFNNPYLLDKKRQQLDRAKRGLIITKVFKDGEFEDDNRGFLATTSIGYLRDTLLKSRNAIKEIGVSDKTTVRSVMNRALSPYINERDREFVKMTQTMLTNIFDYAMQTSELGKKVVADIPNTMIGDNSIVRRMNKFVKAVKEQNQKVADQRAKGDFSEKAVLEGNYFIETIQVLPSRDTQEKGTDNLKLKLTNNEVYDQNRMIYAFRELKEFLKENKDLYNGLIKLAILQSGLTPSSLSFSSLIPFEDMSSFYNESLLELNENTKLDVFNDLNAFERNNWNNSDIVKSAYASFVPVNDSRTGKKDWKYNPNMNFLPPFIKQKVKNKEIPIVMTMGVGNIESNYDIISYTWENQYEDVYTKEEMQKMRKQKKDPRTVWKIQKEEMRKNGDLSFVNKVLMKKVRQKDGSEFERKQSGKKYFVYKAINAWGNGARATEFYDTAAVSQIDNGFIEVYNEASDATIIDAFTKVKTKNKDENNTNTVISKSVKKPNPNNTRQIKGKTYKFSEINWDLLVSLGVSEKERQEILEQVCR